jgi:hypothetical protein
MNNYQITETIRKPDPTPNELKRVLERLGRLQKTGTSLT